MTERRLFDTNILIYFLNGDSTVRDLVDRTIQTQTAYYSPITRIELLSYPNLTETESQNIRDFLHHLQMIELNELMLDRTADIRRTTRIKLPDALIAACAIESNCTMVTRNVKDFEHIADLTLENPYDNQP